MSTAAVTPDDPYAQIAKPIADDPYAAIAKPIAAPAGPTAENKAAEGFAITPAKFGTGMVKGLGNTIAGISEGIHSLPMVGPKIIPDEGLQRFHELTQPKNLGEQVGHAAEQGAEFLLPGGAEEKAGLKAAELFPRAAKYMQPIARMATAGLTTGALNKAQGGEFGTGAGAGIVGGMVGEGARALAPKVAESALRVRKADRMFGRTPGEAILNETTGINPAKIATQAQDKLGNLTDELNTSARNSTTRATLRPAQNALMDAINDAKNRNSFPMVRRLQTVEKQLSTDIRSGLPLAPTQRAAKVLEMKRGIGELVRSWPAEEQIGIDPILKRVYGALDGEVDRTVPGSEKLNSRISGLIPVAKRAESVSRNADVSQRVFNRVAAHTGALAGGIGGGAYGYQHGGAPGLIGGVIGGMVAPELIASPSAQMAMARHLASPRFGTLTKGMMLQIARPSDTEEVDRARR